MPIHRPRSRRSRAAVPFVLGLVAFIAIGSVEAARLGPTPNPPTGMVAGAVDVADPQPPTSSAPTDATDAAETSGAAKAAEAAELSETTDVNDGRGQSAFPTTALALRHAHETGRGGPPPLDALSGYRWPLARARITLPFGPTPWGSWIVDGERFHDGVDLATVCGARIVAAHAGIVLTAGRHFDDALGWLGDLGQYYRRLDAKKLWSTLPIVVVIDDGNGYRSVYAHFEKIVVKGGQKVRAGALLGYEGSTGHASGCHLHYGLFSPYERTEFAIDPAIARRMKLPGFEIARVDPLLVLPARPPRTPTAAPGPSTAP